MNDLYHSAYITDESIKLTNSVLHYGTSISAAARPGRQRAAERRRLGERGGLEERPGRSRSDLSDAASAKLRRCREPALARAPALPWDSPLYLPVLRFPRNAVLDGKKGMLLTCQAVGRPHSEMDIFLWSNH